MPIATLSLPNRLLQCTVDPASRNLAVVDGVGRAFARTYAGRRSLPSLAARPRTSRAAGPQNPYGKGGRAVAVEGDPCTYAFEYSHR